MKSVLSKRTQETIWNEVLDLKEQCGIIKFLVNLIPTKKLVQWQKVTSSLLNKIINFARRYHIYNLNDGYEFPSTLFESKRPNETNAEMYRSRPDIIIRERNCIIVIELTRPFEINLVKSHNYKNTKYQNLSSALLNPCSHFKLILLEISFLGFTGSSTKTFETHLNGKNLDSARMMKKFQEVVIRASNHIYFRRNKIWSDPDLISYT